MAKENIWSIIPSVVTFQLPFSPLPSDFIVPCSSQHSYRVILLHRGAVGILSSFIMLLQKQNGGRDAGLNQAR